MMRQGRYVLDFNFSGINFSEVSKDTVRLMLCQIVWCVHLYENTLIYHALENLLLDAMRYLSSNEVPGFNFLGADVRLFVIDIVKEWMHLTVILCNRMHS